MVGTIISVVITLALIFVFRQVDKNNRSLERVKKYGDKLRDDLNIFVKEKTDGIEQSSVELETQKKATIAAIKRLESIETDIKNRSKTLESVQTHITNYDTAIRELVQMTERAETNLKNLQTHSTFTDTLAKKLNSAQEQLNVLSTELPALKESFQTENKSSMAELQNNVFASFQEQITTIEQMYSTAMDTASDKASKLEEAAFEKMKKQAVERAIKFKDQIEEKYTDLHEKAKEQVQNTQQLVKNFQTEWKTESASMLDTLNNMENASNEGIRTLEQKTEELADKALSSINIQLDSYKNEIQQKFVQLDGATKDIERIEAELRLLMDDAEKRVSSDFEVYAASQNDRYAQQEKDFDAKQDVISTRMSSLEGELTELKSKAYENVSEKLKIFEDDFFKDLAERNNNINIALAEWQSKISEELNKVSIDTDSRQKDAITGLSENMKKGLIEVQERFKDQTSRLEELVTTSGEELRNRISQYEETLNGFTEKYREDMQEVRGTAETSLHREIDNYALSTQEYLRKQEKELSTQTITLQELVKTSQSEASTAIENARSDFALWKTRIEQDMTESKDNLKQKLVGMETSTKDILDRMQQSFDAEKDQISVHISEQQSSIQERTSIMEERLSTISSDLESKTKDAEDTIKEIYSVAINDIQTRMKDGSQDAENKLRDLRQMVQEIREKTESTQDSVLQKIENRASLLNQNLDEIDKRQKAFIAQTRIFDRAEELQKNLENGISSLKDDMKRLEDWKRDLSEMDVQFAKIKKQEEETNQKLYKFLAERKRIDDLEIKFNRLMDLSQSMDQKLSDVSMTDSTIQQFQLDLRKCQEGLADANNRYDRLEKKEHILNQTIENVDKVFETYRDMENRAQSLRSELSELPSQVDDIKRNLVLLSDNQTRADSAIEKVQKLDSILDQTEKKLSKLQQDREWIARTETRLTTVSKQAQDQITLMGDLIKKELPSGNAAGAPPISTRETVKKLASLNWKPEAIASRLNLSVSEVELIMEMTTDD